MEEQLEQPQIKPDDQPEQQPNQNKESHKKRVVFLALIVAIVVLAIGGIVFALTRPDAPTSDECAPRNTPTCGPDGKRIGGSASGNTVAKVLESVKVSNIKLSGAGPQGLDIDPKTGYVYVANNGTIISGCKGDATSGREGNPAPAPGPRPEDADTLSIVDPATGKEIAYTATEGGPVWPLVDTARNVVYVAGSGTGKIALHKLGTAAKLSTINVGGKPHAFGLKGKVLIVSNTHDSSQTYMTSVNADTKAIIKAQKAPEYPHGIAYDGQKNVFYMVGVKTGDVAVIDADTGDVKETFPALGGQFGNSNMLAFSEKTRKLFISDTQNTSSVTAINVDTRKKEGTIRFTETSAPAWGLQVDDENGLLYAALPNADAVGIADIKDLKPLGVVKVGTCPYAVRLDLSRGLAITANQVDANVSTFKLKDVMQALGR